MAAVAEKVIDQYRMPLWLIVTLAVGTGVGVATVTLVTAALAVLGALAGNPSLPEVLAGWGA